MEVKKGQFIVKKTTTGYEVEEVKKDVNSKTASAVFNTIGEAKANALAWTNPLDASLIAKKNRNNPVL